MRILTSLYNRLQEISNLTPQVLVLYYHRVLPSIEYGDPLRLQVTMDNFRTHLDFLSSSYGIISLQDFALQVQSGHFSNRRQIVITFDDGYRDNYLYAYPLLNAWNVPATIFITSDYIDTQTTFFWEQLQYSIFNYREQYIELKIPAPVQYSLTTEQEKCMAFLQLHRTFRQLHPSKCRDILKQFGDLLPGKWEEGDLPLTWEQVREMSQTVMSFGAHTCSHPVLSTLAEHEAEQEILQSKHIIEERLQQEINLFAYPYGTQHDFNQQTMSLVKRHNFLCACSTCFGTNTVSSDLFAIKRVVVQNWDAVSLARKIAHVFRHQEWVL